MDTVRLPARSMYYGTVVALITTVNSDGSDNLTAISSIWPADGYLCLGIGAASQTAANLRLRPRFAVNLPTAAMWPNVEALSSLTGRAAVPEHKLAQYQFSEDKFAAAGLVRDVADTTATPSRVRGCPLRFDVQVESLREIDDAGEPFLVVLARIEGVQADDTLVDAQHLAVSTDAWHPLIFSFRSYRGLSRAVAMEDEQEAAHTHQPVPTA